MNCDFTVTDIQRVIYVSENEYTEKELHFFGDLCSNELIFHLSGQGTVIFNGITLSCTENTIRFLPKGKNEGYDIFDDEKGACIDVFFNSNKPISDKAFALNLKNNSRVKALFKRIFSVWVSKNDGYYFECIGLLYEILAEMQRNNYITNDQNDTIAPAVRYIEESFLTERISVAALAEKCGISESYLKKLFIKRFSVPPSKYIIQMKINYACDLFAIEKVLHRSDRRAQRIHEHPFFLSSI